jgi:hypothetical protein
MYLLRSVDVWSCAKVAGVLYGCLALLFIPFALIAITASAASPHPYGAGEAIALVLLAIFAPVLYGVLGFLFGALSAWLYNITAKYAGGIRLNLREERVVTNPANAIGSI